MTPNNPIINYFLSLLNPPEEQKKTENVVPLVAQQPATPAPFCGNCKDSGGCIHCEGHIGKKTNNALKQVCFGVVTNIEEVVEPKKSRRKKSLEQLTKEFNAACLEKNWEKMEKINMQILDFVKQTKG